MKKIILTNCEIITKGTQVTDQKQIKGFCRHIKHIKIQVSITNSIKKDAS